MSDFNRVLVEGGMAEIIWEAGLDFCSGCYETMPLAFEVPSRGLTRYHADCFGKSEV